MYNYLNRLDKKYIIKRSYSNIIKPPNNDDWFFNYTMGFFTGLFVGNSLTRK
jgi:hypothetical protein